MTRNLNLVVVVSLTVVGAIACQKQSSSKESKAAASQIGAPKEEAKHAATGAKPGSHEDWCDEHQLPESMCTRCNPKLIAAFKATGDWCEEHGVPESQCRLCNPSLKIERPPKTPEGTK
ncbi:MAG: hypothetical protein HY698_14535 [Deltaproteobacteria bacterium]|nr:hypothetical protein [Deltaproteobacteria bacterium]